MFKSVVVTICIFFTVGMGNHSKAQLFPDSMEYYSSNSSGDYSLSKTFIYSYDSSGNLVEEIETDRFGKSWKSIFLYQFGMLVEETRFKKDNAQGWVVKNKTVHFYDTDGTDTAELHYVYNNPLNPFLSDGWRISLLRDGLGRVTASLRYVPDNSDWFLLERVLFYYSGNDTIPYEAIAQWFDSDLNDWINVTRLYIREWELGFNPYFHKTQPSVLVAEYWEDSTWTKGLYDSMVVENGKIKEEFRSWYNEDSADYVLGVSLHNAYDSLGARVFGLEIRHDRGGLDTLTLTHDTFFYGGSGEIRIHSHYSESEGAPVPHRYREVFFYGTMAFAKPVSQGLNLFPNPVSAGQSVYFTEPDLEELRLYDAKGRLVRVWSRETEDGFSTEGLQPGVYFLRADARGKQFTGRLVIR